MLGINYTHVYVCIYISMQIRAFLGPTISLKRIQMFVHLSRFWEACSLENVLATNSLCLSDIHLYKDMIHMIYDFRQRMMQHRNPNVQWISERLIPKAKYNKKQQENLFRNKQRGTTILTIFYRTECWIISTQMKRKLEVAGIWYYGRILRIL